LCLFAEFNLKEDVAGATLMAFGTSLPELIISCVSTFMSDGDISVNTIVGSAVFNVLAVPACCGFFVCAVIQLDWWAISRDFICYSAAVIGLIVVIYDRKIMWHEAAALVIGYAIYLISKLNCETREM